MIVAMNPSMAPLSETWRRPSLSMMASAVCAARPHLLENNLRLLAGDGAVVDALEHPDQQRRRHLAGADADPLAVEIAAEIAEDPVGRRLGWGAGGDAGVEVMGDLLLGDEDLGIARRQAQLGHEALHLGDRQFREGGAHRLDPLAGDLDGDEVGIGEVAVVVRLLLAAHRAGGAALGVVEAGLLHHPAALLDELGLALDLVLDRLLDEAEGVDVLDLGAGAELLLPPGADGDVGVAAEGALFEVAVARRRGR